MKARELILISPYAIHSFSVDGDSKIRIDVFSEDFILSFSKNNSHKSYSQFECGERTDAFLNEFLFHTDKIETYLTKACLYIVCAECIKNARVFDTRTNDDFRDKIIEFISVNMCENITLSSLADALGYEYHYFSSLFYRCFKMHFREFLNMFRIEYACEMLSRTDKNITDISGECGFQSPRTFDRIFRKLSGRNPSEFRKTCE